MERVTEKETMSTSDRSGLEARYAQERDKQLRPEGFEQYIPLRGASEPLASDPWIDTHSSKALEDAPLRDGDDIKFLIIGAGHVGLLAGGRLVAAGFDGARDIRLVDVAGGFGGTWYWNRYPGLQCDVESYVYLPFLEETGYVPASKYAAGSEIRRHCERVAAHFGLRGLFATRVVGAEWDEGRRRWVVRMRRERGGAEMTVFAQFLIPASGHFTAPKAPKLPGFDDLRRTTPVFHTARWHYDQTGGSPEDPALTKLQGKRVGVIGTGATAVQVVPQVARWAEHLYVFQRTPSYCGPRRQQPTDRNAWARNVASGAGWQRARQLNFDSFLSGEDIGPGHPDRVRDGWTELGRGFAGFVGGPRLVTAETVDEHARALAELDAPLVERAREHVRRQVADPATAEKLLAWYPGWCKRPTFHDDYLPAFNRPNVTLVDTDGRGVERCTSRGVVANGTEYELDLVILATGFSLASGPESAPGALNGVRIVGRGGRRIEDKWGAPDFGTLHGIATNGFPNLFFPGLSGGVGSANLTGTFDIMATHIANVLAVASRRAGDPAALAVEPAKKAEDAWTDEVEKRALWFSVVRACTPGYFNHEGATLRPQAKSDEEHRLAARKARFGGGVGLYARIVDEYDAKGDLAGFEISG